MSRRHRQHLPPRRPAGGPARRPRPDRLGALEARHRRALRRAARADHRDTERRRPGVPPGSRGHARLRSLRRRDPAPQESARGARGRAGGRACRSSSSAPRRIPAVARELREQGATLRGYVPIDELAALYRGAACLVQASHYEGFGLPVLEAMASGTPVVTVRGRGALEVAGERRRHRRGSRSRGRDPARARRPRGARRPPGSSGRAPSRGGPPPSARSPSTRRRSAVTVSAVVVSHGHAAELERSLAALVPQVDEIVVVANLPGSVGAVPAGVRVLENSTAAVPGGQRQRRHCGDRRVRTSCSRTPMQLPQPDAVGCAGRRSWTRTPGAGSPARRCCGRTGPGSRRAGAFPTVSGTIVRRTPLRRLYPPYERQREHYLLDERPTEPVAGRLDARCVPAPAAHDARGDRRLGRRLSALRRGHRPVLSGDASRVGALVRPGCRRPRMRTPP